MRTPDPIRVKKDAIRNFDTSSYLTIHVGVKPYHKSFLVHEGIICARSAFFRHAMNGNWAENETRTTNMPEDDPDIFGIYVNLVYTNALATRHDVPGRTVMGEDLRDEHIVLCRLYVLSEKLQDVKAKNAIIKAIVAVSHETPTSGPWLVPSPRAVNMIYEGTIEGNPARRLMVDLWTGISSESLASHCGILSHDFIVDIAVALRKQYPMDTVNKARMSEGTPYLEAILAEES